MIWNVLTKPFALYYCFVNGNNILDCLAEKKTALHLCCDALCHFEVSFGG
jgi:hypothetical protein